MCQAVKQDLSEVFAIYVSFATELEEQSKQLLEKVEQASSGLNGHRRDELQSECLNDLFHSSALQTSTTQSTGGSLKED